MANLSINEITRESKEYRAELLVDKIFEVGGNSPNFMTDNGLMMATAIVLNGEKYVVSNQFKNKTYTQDLANKILAMKGNARSSSVEIVSTYAAILVQFRYLCLNRKVRRVWWTTSRWFKRK